MKVISGGQTGADLAGWRAAKAVGLDTGGWMPRRFLAEDGRHPEFAELYGARETASSCYPERTRKNAREADAMIWFGDPQSRGGRLTLKCFVGPYLVVIPGDPDGHFQTRLAADWLIKRNCKVLNIAGNRESSSPGIGEWVERYLTEVFKEYLSGSSSDGTHPEPKRPGDP